MFVLLTGVLVVGGDRWAASAWLGQLPGLPPDLDRIEETVNGELQGTPPGHRILIQRSGWMDLEWDWVVGWFGTTRRGRWVAVLLGS